jgi:protein-tyrosine phosphatase
MSAPQCAAGRPWRLALVWLVVLAVLFYSSYGFALWASAQRSSVGSIVFDWERHIPFAGWTIFPYWSVNGFYAASFFVCATRAELLTHVKRLLTAQALSVTVFLLYPLRFSFERPPVDGAAGFMFDVLAGFDRPFNQMPSLHISLLVILWFLYAAHLPRRWHGLLHGWFALIGLSILTTYQHHFIDLPTGLWVGLFCVWLFPLHAPAAEKPAPQLRLAAYYLIGATALAVLALALGGAAFWLLWASGALALVAGAYAGLGTPIFHKTDEGRHQRAARWLLWPYLWGAWLNSRAWTWRAPAPVQVADGVYLGRVPSARELRAGGFCALLDLTAECEVLPGKLAYRCVPLLDLVPPSAAQLQAAAEAIEALRPQGKTLVCCALGYGRSAAAVAAWLLHSGRASTAAQAVQRVRRARPQIVLGERVFAALAALPAR